MTYRRQQRLSQDLGWAKVASIRSLERAAAVAAHKATATCDVCQEQPASIRDGAVMLCSRCGVQQAEAAATTLHSALCVTDSGSLDCICGVLGDDKADV